MTGTDTTSAIHARRCYPIGMTLTCTGHIDDFTYWKKYDACSKALERLLCDLNVRTHRTQQRQGLVDTRHRAKHGAAEIAQGLLEAEGNHRLVLGYQHLEAADDAGGGALSLARAARPRQGAQARCRGADPGRDRARAGLVAAMMARGAAHVEAAAGHLAFDA